MALTPSNATPDDIDKYTSGECHVFALSLHRYLGWPVYLVLDHSEPCDGGSGDVEEAIPAVCHAFAIGPDGSAWDIKGQRPVTDIESEIREWIHVGEFGVDFPCTEQDLLAYTASAPECFERPLAPYTDEGVAQAWATARKSLFSVPAFVHELAQTAPARWLSELLGGIETRAAPDKIAMVSAYADQYQPGEPGHSDPGLLEWFEVSDYPIARLGDAVDVEWFRAECEMWAEEGEPDRFDDMLHEPIHSPVIVYDDGQGGWTWDGNHRIGATLTKGQGSVRAIVGVRPQPYSDQLERPQSVARPRP